MTMGILEGALIALAGVLLGRYLPNRRKGPKPPKPVEAICGCGHHHSYHEAGSGACAHVEQEYRGSGEYVDVACTCRHYSGPVPMPEVYAPEITS